MSDDEARHLALDLMGLPREKHPAAFTIHDQLEAWQAEHPDSNPFTSGECDHLYLAMADLVLDK